MNLLLSNLDFHSKNSRLIHIYITVKPCLQQSSSLAKLVNEWDIYQGFQQISSVRALANFGIEKNTHGKHHIS